MLNRVLCLILMVTSFSASSEPASRESVLLLMEKTGAGELGVMAFNQMLPGFKKACPNASSEFWDEVSEEFNPTALVNLVVPVYQKYLSEEDVKAIIKFYDSPSGRNLIMAQPMITKESMALGQQWGDEIFSSVREKYKEKFGKNMSK